MNPRPIQPASGPVRGVARVPGSKSITNRALVLAALADGPTRLENALFADDSARMRDCLTALGFNIASDPIGATAMVQGLGGRIPATAAQLFVGNSGTTARFVTPVLALGRGEFTVDGVARMRERPIGDLLSALCQLGVRAESDGGFPPVRIFAEGLRGGACTLRADASSQFVSGLLLAAPCADADETRISLEGPILSAPYIAMTVALVRRFGATLEVCPEGRHFTVPGRQTYRAPGVFGVEPDASAASYFWAAAAVTGGSVRIEGIGRDALQGDVAFVDVLEAMGARVEREADAVTVHGPERLRGVRVDMNAISDTVMTLAAIAPFADGPTVIQNVGHIRHKETDRLSAVVNELTRLGVSVEERADGLTIHPCGALIPADIHTYDDHRMAMAFAITGLKSPGVRIIDPGCVAKTFPEFFDRLDALFYGEAQ